MLNSKTKTNRNIFFINSKKKRNKIVSLSKKHNGSKLNKPKIFISGGFKCGTTTLTKTFGVNKSHEIIPNCENRIIKNNINCILFPFRNVEEIYPSALFQDIEVPNYEYSPFASNNFLEDKNRCKQNCICECRCKFKQKRKKIIKNIDIKLLIEHYKKIDWDKFLHLNSKLRIKMTNKKYNINIDYNLKEYQIFDIVIKNRKIKLISFNISILNSRFNELQTILYGKNIKTLKKTNVGITKWYSQKYKEFLLNL